MRVIREGGQKVPTNQYSGCRRTLSVSELRCQKVGLLGSLHSRRKARGLLRPTYLSDALRELWSPVAPMVSGVPVHDKVSIPE